MASASSYVIVVGAGDIATPAPDELKAAHALHHAIREVRAEYPDTPALWAAHFHVGP